MNFFLFGFNVRQFGLAGIAFIFKMNFQRKINLPFVWLFDHLTRFYFNLTNETTLVNFRFRCIHYTYTKFNCDILVPILCFIAIKDFTIRFTYFRVCIFLQYSVKRFYIRSFQCQMIFHY